LTRPAMRDIRYAPRIRVNAYRKVRTVSRRTALHDQHVALGGRMVDFHGWTLPVQYEGILAEHRHCRTSAVLFDTSHMGQIIITADEPGAINRVTTQDAASLGIGRARYGFLLNEDGGIIDDTVLMRLEEKQFLLVVNAGTVDSDFEWVGRHLSGTAKVTNQSAGGWGKIDLQGPDSAKVIAPHTGTDLKELGYFRVARSEVCGRECILSRTGYTGELGYEIFAPDESIREVFPRLIEDSRVRAAGLGARDSLRLEMCYPLHGQDISPEVNPLEADLGVFLKSDHDYIGAESLREQTAAGVDRKLVAFVCATRRRPETGNEILCKGELVGRVTSGAFSPSLNTSIGMGYVPAELTEIGREIVIRTTRTELSARITRKPLYREGTSRTKEI